MTAVKICGIRDAETFTTAIKAGADFIGLVFYPPSPRYVTPENAALLTELPKKNIRIVGLFVNPTDEELLHTLSLATLDMIQLHGEEPPARIAHIAALCNRPVIKALRLGGPEDLRDVADYEQVADWLLFDSKSPVRTPPPSKRGEAGRGVAKNARILRKTMTEPERLLWTKLSHKQIDGFKFRRQHPLPPYVADFACPEARLIIELDGAQHAEKIQYDERRTQTLERYGYHVLRFWNNQLYENIEGVLETIRLALSNPPPLSSPPSEGGGYFALPGGTGQSFDWDILKGRRFKKPWMLSGGLTPQNVGQALEILNPDALDVSSGVESARGVKDPEKIRAFINISKFA